MAALAPASPAGPGDGTPPAKPLIAEEDTEATIRERYQEEIQTCRKLQGQVVLLKRKLEASQKDKESAMAALTRIQAVRTKLESVCRQLQKQNKAIEDESLERVKEDAEQRSDLSEKFHQTITDVTKRMEEHTGDRDMLHRDRDLLKDRIKNLEEQLTLRDQHYAQQLKTKELQLQLLATRLKQQLEIFEQDEYRRGKFRERLSHQSAAEEQLRQQLVLYGSKFEQFHSTLQSSNTAFENFQRDLSKMTERHRQAVATNQRLMVKAGRAADALAEQQADAGEWQQRAKQAETLNAKLAGLVAVLRREVLTLAEEAAPAPAPAAP